MTTSAPATALPEWADYMAILGEAEALVQQWPEASDPHKRQQLHQLMFAAIATGYHTAFVSPDAPDFIPVVSSVLHTIGANPDFIYAYTALDGAGTYCITGQRGDEAFIFIDLTAGGFGVLDQFGPSVACIDIDELTLSPTGEFELLLSQERPADYSGDWHYLDPATKTANLRKGYYHWGQGQEARLSIQRLDKALHVAPLSAEQIAERLKALSAYVQRYVGFILGYGQRQRSEGFVNALEHDDWAGKGGIAGQHYYQGIFELAADEVMLLETDVPDQVRYWNIQVNDALWNTIDWLRHQSSLNGGQAVLDSDGKFRCVISPKDPGIHNWLDTGGQLQGSLMLRWMGASSGPVPQVSIIKQADLAKHLPSDVAAVTPAQRQIALRERNVNAQLRRRW